MDNKLKVAGSLVAVAIVIIGGWWLMAQNKGPVANAKTIKIGMIAPLTGEQANIGEAARNGALLAMDKINSDPSLKYKYELVIEDDSFDPAKTSSAAQKLLSVDNVSAIISVGSGPGNVVAPLAEQAHIPHIGMASDANVAKGDYNFIDWTQPDSEATTLVAQLQKLGLKKVAVLGVNQQGYIAVEKSFTAKATAAGITITSDDTFNPGQKDFRTLIAKAEAKNPDVYLLNAFTPELEVLGQQLKDAGITKPITSIESFGLSAKPQIFEGQWFVNAAVPTSTFADQYKQKYNQPVGPTAPNAYDLVSLIVKATEATGVSGTPTPTQIDQQLLKTNGYSGAMGPLSVTAEGIFLSNPSVQIIKDGKVAPYTTQ